MKTQAHLDELKLVLDIPNAHCQTCVHYEEDWDGENCQIYCGSYCHNENRPNHEALSNLKSFPFKSDQSCWHPEFWCGSLPIQEISNDGEFIDIAGRFYASVIEAIADKHKEPMTTPQEEL